jgi:hypothetical protein
MGMTGRAIRPTSGHLADRRQQLNPQHRVAAEPGNNPDWRTQGMVVIPADALDLLDIEGDAQPDHVPWTDPAHPAV